MNLVKDGGWGTHKTKKAKIEHIEESKEAAADKEKEEINAVLPKTRGNNILYSLFSKAEVYTDDQQKYNRKTFYAHKVCISNSFKGTDF